MRFALCWTAYPVGVFGGGTPSLISPDGIRRIVESACSIYPLQVGAEVTLEANPSEPSQERYEGYRAAGINRVSFGVQSFDERRLSFLGAIIRRMMRDARLLQLLQRE